MTGESDCFMDGTVGTAVCFMADMESIEVGVEMVNLRTKNPSTRASGICFGNLGSTRRSLSGKIIRGVRPAIAI